MADSGDRIQLEKLAVVTLQGGGVYGLTLAGQLDRVINGYQLEPIAVAGTSAGAIVAALYWSGHKPSAIRSTFEGLADRGQIPDLLGPFEPAKHPFNFERLSKLRADVTQFAQIFRSEDGVPFYKRNLFSYLGPALLGGLCLATKHLSALGHIKNRGIFRGDNLETTVETLLRSSPYMRQFDSVLKEIMGADPHLRFKHIAKLEEHYGRLLFPALFITATNLRTQRIEVFNSLDERFAETRIATAVRASGGFPFFFRPVQVQTADSNDWYVDGGVISNFPVWIFGQEVRRKMENAARFKAVAQRPWMNVGLSRVSDGDTGNRDFSDSWRFLTSMLSLFTGSARDNLEELLSVTVKPSRIVRQPTKTTGGPDDVLNVSQITKPKVREMYVKGKWFARGKLRPLTFDLSVDARKEIDEELKLLVERCNLAFGFSNNDVCDFRTNVYLPFKAKLYRRLWQNMNPTTGHGFEFSSGLTGFCFSHRIPTVCNLQWLREAADKGEIGENTFGMSREDHLKVLPSRTWLLSMPIFNPNEFVLPWTTDRSSDPPGSRFHHVLPRVLDGVIYGVLNIDSQLVYRDFGIDADPKNSFTDARLSAIIDFARVSSARIGRRLAFSFGGNEDHVTLE